MNRKAVVSNAKDIADRVLAPAARQNDKEGRFSSQSIEALGLAGLLGLMLPADVGGSALGPRTFVAIVGDARRSRRICRHGLLVHARLRRGDESLWRPTVPPSRRR
jgi:alkylation response protein AidB-like acyl-CoA dehydrogenase